MREYKEICLGKHYYKNERFVFRYRLGQELAVIGAFMELAKDPKINFDKFDAVILTRKIIERSERSEELSDIIQQFL